TSTWCPRRAAPPVRSAGGECAVCSRSRVGTPRSLLAPPVRGLLSRDPVTGDRSEYPIAGRYRVAGTRFPNTVDQRPEPLSAPRPRGPQQCRGVFLGQLDIEYFRQSFRQCGEFQFLRAAGAVRVFGGQDPAVEDVVG